MKARYSYLSSPIHQILVVWQVITCTDRPLILRGKLAICNHRLTKHSSCGKLSEQIDIAALSSLSVTTDSPSTRRVARNCTFVLAKLCKPTWAVSLVAVEKERKGPVFWEVNLVHTRLANQSLPSTSASIMPASTIVCLPGLLVLHFYQRRRIVLSFVEFDTLALAPWWRNGKNAAHSEHRVFCLLCGQTNSHGPHLLRAYL